MRTRWATAAAVLVVTAACTPGPPNGAPEQRATGPWPERATVHCAAAVARPEPGDPSLAGVDRTGFVDSQGILVPDPARGLHFAKLGLIVTGGSRVEVTVHTEGLALNYGEATARTLVFDCATEPDPYHVFVGGLLASKAYAGPVQVSIAGDPVELTLAQP